MRGLTGLRAAAPIWHDFMERALADQPVLAFAEPPGLVHVAVCARSGMLPTPYCGPTRDEVFLKENPPRVVDTLFVPVRVHTESGLRAAANVPADLTEVRVFMAVPEEAQGWAEQAGIALPPQGEFRLPSAEPVVITAPQDGEQVRSILEVKGNAFFPGFAWYEVSYAGWLNPEQWVTIQRSTEPRANTVLAAWDTIQNPDGMYTIRLTAQSTDGTQYMRRVTIVVRNNQLASQP